MKTKKLILLSLISLSIGAQDLNQEFLDSLPEDIKKDIQDNNTATALDSNETYRPYLYSSKLKQTEELLNLKDRLEKELEKIDGPKTEEASNVATANSADTAKYIAWCAVRMVP